MKRTPLAALMSVSFLMASCGPSPTPATPTHRSTSVAEAPVDPATLCFGSPDDSTPAEDLPPLEARLTPVEGEVVRVEVRMIGELDESLVGGLISSKPGESVDRAKIASDVRRLFGLGNFEDVSVEATESDKGWVLTYVVRERPVLSAVLIQGVAPERQTDVEAAAGQHRGDLYIPAAVLASAAVVRAHLVERGHARAKVETFVRRPDARTASLCIQVDAGPVVRVEALHFDGHAKLDAAQLEAAVRSAGVEENLPGGFLDLEKLTLQLLYVSARYYDAGMVEAKVGEPEVRYSEDGSRVVIHVPVEEGPIFRIGELSFGGEMAANAVKYRAALGFASGDVFDRSRVMTAIEKLNALRVSEGASGAVTPETQLHVEKQTVVLTFQPSK